MIALAILSTFLSLSLSLSLSLFHIRMQNTRTHECAIILSTYFYSFVKHIRHILFFSFFAISLFQLSILTWFLCSGVEGGFGVFGREPPVGVQCRSRARAVRSPSVTRLFYLVLAVPLSLSLSLSLSRLSANNRFFQLFVTFPRSLLFSFYSSVLFRPTFLHFCFLCFLLSSSLFLSYPFFLLFFSILFARQVELSTD